MYTCFSLVSPRSRICNKDLRAGSLFGREGETNRGAGEGAGEKVANKQYYEPAGQPCKKLELEATGKIWEPVQNGQLRIISPSPGVNEVGIAED